jgi:hypothetical protein
MHHQRQYIYLEKNGLHTFFSLHSKIDIESSNYRTWKYLYITRCRSSTTASDPFTVQINSQHTQRQLSYWCRILLNPHSICWTPARKAKYLGSFDSIPVPKMGRSRMIHIFSRRQNLYNSAIASDMEPFGSRFYQTVW